MAIEHSKALGLLESWHNSLEPKLIEFKPLEDPVFAHPLSAAQVDSLRKYEGYEYNVRILQASLKYENGERVFYETDIPKMLRTDPAVLSAAANQVVGHIFSSFDQIKNS